MKIKKFRSKTFQEGKEKILSELGPEAVILSTRTIPPAPPDNEEMVELVAAIDLENELSTIEESSLTKIEPSKIEKEPGSGFWDLVSNLYKELSLIKNYIFELSDKITYSFIKKLPKEYEDLAKLMLKNGFSQDFVLPFVNKLLNIEFNNIDLLREKALDLLVERLVFAEKFPISDKQNIILFVGPTGTGKTLNIVKLGVLYKILLNVKVSIISADYRKIGGWEQLQILSAVSGLNSIFCQSNDELVESINSLKSADIILVDTSGGSPRDENFLEELKEINSLIAWTSKVLVLSATQSKMNFKECVEAFKKITPNYLIITKFDEINTIGSLYEILYNIGSEIPLLYFSFGTDIPNTIEPATKGFIRKYLINPVE